MSVISLPPRELSFADQERLASKLKRNSHYNVLPSRQMQAWQDQEFTQFGITGRRGPPHLLAYNLYTDTTRILGSAFELLTRNPKYIRMHYGFTPKTAPRRALAGLARAFGYRYIRGLVVIQLALPPGPQLVQFHQERAHFRAKLESTMDEAHQMSDLYESRQAALDAVMLFASELFTLCRWLELTGHEHDAKCLRTATQEAIAP